MPNTQILLSQLLPIDSFLKKTRQKKAEPNRPNKASSFVEGPSCGPCPSLLYHRSLAAEGNHKVEGGLCMVVVGWLYCELEIVADPILGGGNFAVDP